MSKKIVNIALLMSVITINVAAQQTVQPPINRQIYEDYGNTLNIGVGVGYYDYVGHSITEFHADYEFNVANNFTLAPFIDFYEFQNYNNYAGQEYYYRQTVIPIGVKGTYYLDRILHANGNWDFYLAASLGLIVRNRTWQSGYEGQTAVDNGSGALYLSLHAGTEYHVSRRIGLYLDLSTAVSTVGIAVHGR